MARIGTPLKTPTLNLQPESEGGIELSKDMQQVLSLLAGFWRNQRNVIGSTPNGALFVTSFQVQDVVIYTATGDSEDKQFDNIPCSECIILAHPDNTDRIYFRPHTVATSSTGFPLDAGDYISVGITNLDMININLAKTGDKVVILYA